MPGHTATLAALLDQLAVVIVAARTADTVPYAEARRLFRRVDALQEQMEFLLVETKDYPDQQDDD